MSSRTFSDRRGRFFARKGRKLAWSMTSPTTIIVTGVATAAAVLIGWPVLAVAAIAAGTYATKVAVSTLSGRELIDMANPEIDMSRLRDPYREWVERGIASRDRYREALKEAPPGPLGSRLGSAVTEIDEVLAGLARIARRAQGIDDYLSQSSTRTVDENLRQAKQRLAETSDPDIIEERQRTVESLEEQAKVANRMRNTYDRSMSRMESTIITLDQLCAQLAEVLLATEDAQPSVQASGERSGLDDLVDQLEAVREAVAELDPTNVTLTHAEYEVTAAIESASKAPQSHQEPA